MKVNVKVKVKVVDISQLGFKKTCDTVGHIGINRHIGGNITADIGAASNYNEIFVRKVIFLAPGHQGKKVK